jgi:lipoprotein-anchoring transpeptidase ErfK/SrfK
MGAMTSHLPRVVLGVIAAVTLLLSAGGALGVWPTGAPASRWDHSAAAAPAGAPRSEASLRPAAAHPFMREMEGVNGDVHRGETFGAPEPAPGPAQSPTPQSAAPSTDVDPTALPYRSGAGRRVVFDMSGQRVWLVGPAGNVQRTYPVSGSRTDNLSPGRYDVYSRSRHAVSYTYEETMQYMVRFAQGEQAAIGFHDIPRDQQGDPVQTRAQLGRALSSGCIRQARKDAVALWRFADVGTEVVVVR